MIRYALLGLAVSLVACNRGPTNRAVFEQNQAFGVTLGQGIAAAVKSVEAAPPATLDAPCEARGLTLDQDAGFDAEQNKTGAGNTEVVVLRSLSGAWKLLDNPPGEAEVWKSQDPAGYHLRLTGFSSNVPIAHHQLSPGGFLYQGGTAPDDRVVPQLLAQIERAKGVSHLLVIRGQKRSDDGRSQVVEVHHVAFPGGKLLCSFAYQGKVPASVENNDTIRIQRSGGMETRTAGVNDKIGRALRESVITELGVQLKKRFDITTLPKTTD